MLPFLKNSYEGKVGVQERDVNSFVSGMMNKRGPESAMAIPHVISIQAVIGSAYQTYWHSRYDEAIRDSQQNADALRNDPFLRRLMDERKYAVCSLRSSIEVDNQRDPWQKAVKDSLTQQWKSIPRSYDLNWYMLEAEWYGRYGGQMTWGYRTMDLPAFPRAGGAAPGLPAILGAPVGREKRRVLCMTNHMPYEGDKIGYDYSGCPYVLISTMAATNIKKRYPDAEIFDGSAIEPQQGLGDGNYPNVNARSMEYGYTTAGGKALFLRTPSWRQRFAIHSGEILDSPFLDAEKGDQIHGIGIRSVIYWYWWLRDEFLSNVADWCERTGLGIRLWYYDASNPASEEAIDRAARDQSDKVNIKIPRQPGSDAQEGVEMVETSGTGADLLLNIVKYLDEHIELYVVGQSMSRGSQDNNGSGFGDRGRADFARSTKYQITKRSAAKYSCTMTDDVLSVMKRWSLPPDLQEIPARVVFETDNPDPETYMGAAKTFCDLGGKIVADEARQALGLSSPHEGDEVLGGVAPLPPGMGGGGVPVEKGKEEKPLVNGKPEGKPEMNGHAKERFEMLPKESVSQKWKRMLKKRM